MSKDNSTTTTSGLNNAELNQAVSTIGSQLNTNLGQGFKGYTGNRVPDMSSQTQAGIGGLSNNPLTPGFNAAVGNTMNEFGAIASGQRMGDGDAAWASAKDRVVADTNAAFNASGRFGGDSNMEAVSEGLGRVELSRLTGNEARQMQAAGMLPGLYSASNMPASAQLQVGQITDQFNAAKAQEAERLFNVNNNAGWETLRQGGQILGTTAPSAGTTTTQTQNIPWWQTGLGIGAGLMSFM